MSKKLNGRRKKEKELILHIREHGDCSFTLNDPLADNMAANSQCLRAKGYSKVEWANSECPDPVPNLEIAQ